MKLGFRTVANLVLVAVLTVVALGWAALGLARVNPFDEPATVRVRLAQAGGALPGARVTYLGVPIGEVTDVALVDDEVELHLSVEPVGPMAKELRADVTQKSSLGEPFVDLSPATPESTQTGDPDGAVIPVERTSVPRPLHELLTRTEEILTQIEPAHVGAIAEGMSGVIGRDDEIRSLLATIADVSDVFGRRRTELGEFVTASARLAATLDAHRQDLAGATTGYARLGEVLARRTDELGRILDQGARLGTEASDTLDTAWPGLLDTVEGLDVTFHNLAIRPKKMAETLHWLPTFMERFSYIIEGDALNVSVGSSLIPIVPGYQPRLGIPIYGEGLRLDKILVPSLAQRVDIDFAKYQGQGRTVAYLSPAEARFALQGLDQYLSMVEQKRAEHETGRIDPAP